MFPALRLQVPTLSARISPAVTASTLARLIGSGIATSKADLVRVTGLSRSTVDAGLHRLADLGAIRGVGYREAAGRGRRAELLEVDPSFGATTVIDFGASIVRVAVADLGQNLMGYREHALDIASGPTVALETALQEAEELLELADLREHYRVTVVGVPGPVDSRTGTVVRPPIMPGWDGYDIASHVRARLGGDVLVANDVNLRALGEARASESSRPLLYVKIGTGIGAGFTTAQGDLLSGADGAAGDIGHLRAFGSTAPCSCGHVGCLEATASVSAIARRLYSDAPDGAERLMDAVRAGDPRARAALTDAATAIGEVIADLVHFYNPGQVLIGGEIATASEDILAGVRSVVYRHALPLATRSLSIEVSPLGQRAGIAGGLVLGTEAALKPERIGHIHSRLEQRQRLAANIRRQSGTPRNRVVSVA
jgi:predicted NBD/HSP70 family sugar kinase